MARKLPEPVPCEVGILRLTGCTGPDCIVIDLTHERAGEKHRTQVRLTPEQLALALTGMAGVTGTVTGYTVPAKGRS
jgi:hypothetical protein